MGRGLTISIKIKPKLESFMMGVNITESSVGQCSPGQAGWVAPLIVGLVASLLYITLFLIITLFLKVTIRSKVRRQKTFDENSRFVKIFSE